MSDLTAEVSVLDWSSTAMRDATGRLSEFGVGPVASIHCDR